MMTPVALRTATTVVPCGMSRPAVDPPDAVLGNWCGATVRSRSANDGPGSIEAANRGNALGSGIGRGAYSGVSARQCFHPSAGQTSKCIIPIEIISRAVEQVVVLA